MTDNNVIQCALCGREIMESAFIPHFEVCFEQPCPDITDDERHTRRRRLYIAMAKVGVWPAGGLPSFAGNPRKPEHEFEHIGGF